MAVWRWVVWCVCLALAWPCGAAAGETVVGWRTDTTGCYPHATPPLHWGVDKNVAWATPMPGRSTATPIIVGDKMFVLAEPFFLICVNKADGKILWQRENMFEKVAPAADIEAHAKNEQRRAELDQKVTQLTAERDTSSEKLKAAPTDDALKAKAAELNRQLGELTRERDRLPKAKAVKPHGAIGQSCCTPLSNGEVVIALYNSGVLVCYDLAGNLRWARFLHRVSKGYGQSMSPALAGGVVGVHIDDAMFGVDLASGRTLWEDYELQHQGSPVGLRVGEMDLFLTCEGHLRRAQDGKILAKIGGALNLFSTPALHGDTGYWISENRRVSICRFLPKDGGVEVKGGGRGVPKGVYYASALVHDGFLYLWNHSPALPPGETGKKPPRTLYAIELAGGKVVAEAPLPIGGNAYPSPAAAGKFVYVSSDSGTCVVLLPGWRAVEAPGQARKEFLLKEVARNTLEPYNACPIFEGDRLYLRGNSKLYCIAAPEADKKEAQALLQAQDDKKPTATP